jgi:hypothetical protein
MPVKQPKLTRETNTSLLVRQYRLSGASAQVFSPLVLVHSNASGVEGVGQRR